MFGDNLKRMRCLLAGWARGRRLTLPMLGSCALCLLSLITIWTGAAYIVAEDYRRSRETAVHDTANLARAFEEHIVRSLQAFDQALLMARDAYQQVGPGFDLPRWVVTSKFRTDVTLNISIADRRGILIASHVGTSAVPVDISDREYFQAALGRTDDELFISKPLIGRVTGKLSLLLGRRITAPTGEFTGLIMLTVDPSYFASFYQSVDLGKYGMVQLVGIDGTVRARVAGTDRSTGQSMTDSTLLRLVRERPSGSFLTRGRLDGVARISSYRKVPGYPLVVTVGLSRNEVFATASANRMVALAGATILSVLLTAFTIVILRGQQRLNASEFRFRSMFDVVPVGIALVGPGGELLEVNRAFARLADRPPGDLAERQIDDILLGHAAGGFDRLRDEADGEEHASHECDVRRPDGSTSTVLCSAAPASSHDTLTWLTMQDISERKRAEAEIRQAAFFDLLTGLPNRKRLCDILDERLATPLAVSEAFALLLLDIDNFKFINDTLGHEAGDVVLCTVAQRISRIRAGSDFVARLGGDEFAIVVGGCGGRQTLLRIAHRVLRSLRRKIVYRGQTIEVRASIGIVICPEHGRTRVDLFRSADLALYRAKHLGRDRAMVFESAMLADTERHYNVITAFRKAAAENRIVALYQPEVMLQTGEVAGFEALARIDAGGGRLLSPAEFGAALNDSESSRILGRHMIEQAVTDLLAWEEAGLDVGRVAVNASHFELADESYASRVVKTLTARGIPFDRFEIEVTETAMIDDTVPAVARNLDALVGHGISIALDDFGTGYASLTHIKSLPIARVKIDRSFIVNITTDPESQAIVEAIIRLSHSLGKTVVAEGIEHPEQMRRLRELGCDAAQGFAIARPMPAEAVGAFLLRNMARHLDEHEFRLGRLREATG